MYHQKKRQKHGKCNGEGKYSTLRVPASLGQLVIVSRKLMHSADIVYKNGRIIVVEITVDMKKSNNCHYLCTTNQCNFFFFFNLQTRTNVIEALASVKDTTVLKGDELGDEQRM